MMIREVRGENRFYSAHKSNNNYWICTNTLPTGLTPILLDDFFKEEGTSKTKVIQTTRKEDYHYANGVSNLNYETVPDNDAPEQPTLPDAAQWFDNNSDCYATSYDYNGSALEVPAMSKEMFLTYLKSINNGK